MSEFSDFLEIQTQTAWGRTLADFVEWSQPAAGILTLDLGTGPGLLPTIFTDRYRVQAIGLDTDLELLRAAPKTLPVIGASVYALPFSSAIFDQITATNVIFLLGDPLRALKECHRVLKPGGTLALLNPSEHLTVDAATTLAEKRNLTGKNRESLLGWAKRAEKHGGWTEEHAQAIHKKAGFTLTETLTRVGPGFARYTRALKNP